MGAWPKWHSGANRPIGCTQLALLAEAAGKSSGQLMLYGTRRDNARWCAMKRMVQRGLFDRYEFYGGVIIYTITDAGRRKLAESRASVKIKGAGS